jgi:hypothetical protein
MVEEMIERENRAFAYLRKKAREAIIARETKLQKRRIILAWSLLGIIGLFVALCLYLATY